MGRRGYASHSLLGLVMIVKNEATNIVATLASIRLWIDHWTILDTGSTDGTQDLIKRELASIPGELHTAPFIDFSTTRNHVLDLHGTTTQFTIMLSGDDIVVGGDRIRAGLVEGAEGYMVERRTGTTSYKQAVIARASSIFDSSARGWRYAGRTHEALMQPGHAITESLPGVSIVRPFPEGSKQARWEADLQLLALDLAEDSTNARAAFYLAQTFECLGIMDHARAAYERRIAMPGWHDETYEALFRRARVMEYQSAWLETQQAYLEAHAFDPRRAEPLYAIARHYHDENNHALAYLFARHASTLPLPDTALFVDREIYEWQAADLCAIHAYYLGGAFLAQGRFLAERAALARPDDERLRKNLAFYSEA